MELFAAVAGVVIQAWRLEGLKACHNWKEEGVKGNFFKIREQILLLNNCPFIELVFTVVEV